MPTWLEGMENDYQTDGYAVYDKDWNEVGILDGDEILLDNGDVDWVIGEW